MQQCLTEGGASVGIGPPLLLAFAGGLLPCCPFFRQRFRNNASTSRNFDGAAERADGPLIHHGPIDVPALVNVEEANQLKRARIFGASSLLGRERLVPVGNGDSDSHALKAFKLGPVVGAGELVNGMVDD